GRGPRAPALKRARPAPERRDRRRRRLGRSRLAAARKTPGRDSSPRPGQLWCLLTSRRGRRLNGRTAAWPKNVGAPGQWRGQTEAVPFQGKRSREKAERVYAENDEPHPQVRVALGLTNLNPAPCRPFT